MGDEIRKLVQRETPLFDIESGGSEDIKEGTGTGIILIHPNNDKYFE